MNNNIFYNAHHSPVGAFASFTLGYKGANGGLGIELSGPANQNVYIGVESDAPDVFCALPFYNYDDDTPRTRPDAINPDDETSKIKDVTIKPFDDSVITREFTPGTDVWRAENLEFAIYTPHLSLPNAFEKHSQDEMKNAIVPAVFVELTIDNTKCGKPRKAFFGYEGTDPYSAMRLFRDEEKFCGIGQGRVMGIFTDDKNAITATAFSVKDLLTDDISGRLEFRLGRTGLVLLTVPANKKQTWKFAVCFFRDGIVTAEKEAAYFYTQYFKDIKEVARHALCNFDFYKKSALDYDKNFSLDKLSAARRFMLSTAIKSYYGSTQFFIDKSKNPLWVVVEGEYRMINTLDLAIDHLFFEMRMNPWVVKSVLEQYADDYSYYDEVKNVSGEKFPGGISFAHDMGVMNIFSPRGQSAYELENLKICYSHMTQEQLANWLICAGVYWKNSGDNKWLKKYERIVKECLTSMLNRDDADENARDGVMDFDSCKTGIGAEITTYDNVDAALGRARRSSYIAAKCWAAYLLLEKMLLALNLTNEAATSREQAKKCAATILKYKRPDGTIPGLLEDGNKATTLSIIEGLIYPYITGMFDDVNFMSDFRDFIDALKIHFETALKSGCKFSNGGWKMSTTSDNTWPSKIFLFQFIAEKIFGLPPDHHADTVHAAWLSSPENSRLAFSDQIIAGKVRGSSYYPRGVTASVNA